MDKEAIKKELEATKKKLAALEVLAGEESEEDQSSSTEEVTEKNAAETFKCPTCDTNVLKKTGYCVKCKKKVGDKPEKKEASEKTAAQRVVEALDEIAGLLESQNDPELVKLAFEIDKVSDMLEGNKEASVLEGDKDEPYMKAHFKAGAPETDKDEPYMKEFNTDTSTELKDKTEKKQLGKDASELPYQIIKE